jgi:hypothetical protein
MKRISRQPRWLIYFGPLTQSVSISLFKDAFIEKRSCIYAARSSGTGGTSGISLSLSAREGRFFFISCREPIYACELVFSWSLYASYYADPAEILSLSQSDV